MTTKVFVGNLDFQTTDQALADAFVDCGKVKSGVIITRGRRSLGYGFVEFEIAEAAEKAVETKNGTELSNRQIKVELVRDPAERPTRTREGQGATDQKQDVERGDQGNRRGVRRGGRGGGGGFGGGSGGSGGGNGGGNGGGSGGKRRFARRSTAPQGKENSNPSSNTQGNNNTRGTRERTKRDSNQDRAPSPKGGDNQDQPAKRRTRRRNNKRSDSNQPQNPPKEKILSKTAIFVANIPFEAKDEDLKDFFKDSNPKSAHVVTTQTGRSRGYGFVDFDNEKDQQHAIQNKNKAKWTTPEKEPREISVSASHSQPKEEPAQSKE